jgi:hypothetical protein
MSSTPRPWIVERHDQEDGTINYEIWCQTAPHYHRVVTLNDYDNENARDDAALIAKVVNEYQELTTALRKLIEMVDAMGKHPRDGGGVFPADYGIVKANARAALEKAEA